MRETPSNRFHAALLALCTGALAPGSGEGLTLFRIGGPPPDEQGVDVVHLSWEEAAAGYGGSVRSLDFEEGRMAPVRLDPDRNISLDVLALGGAPFGAKHVRTQNEFHLRVVDGDPTTAFEEAEVRELLEHPFIGIDLGGILPVKRVVFYPTPEGQDRFVEDFKIYLFGGDPSLLFSPLGNVGNYDLVASVEDNRSPRVEVAIPTRLAHTVMVVIGNPHTRQRTIRPWEIAELEVYGEGFAPTASYFTRILDLGGAASLGEVRWGERREPGASLEIRSRSGSDNDPVRYWRVTGRGSERSYRDGRGRTLTREEYEGMLLTEQAGTSHDAENWSFWSVPYVSGGAADFASPGPNRYVQFQVGFENSGFSGGELGHLEFEVTTPPMAGRVVGEVAPARVEAGRETAFVYAFRPSFTAASSEEAESGFDRFDLSTPGELTGVDSVRVNGEPVPCEIWLDGSLAACADASDPFPGPRVALKLPRMEAIDSGKLVEIFFRARVFRFGTVFDGVVSDSDRPREVGQVVAEGDATFAIDSNRLSVGMGLSGSLLQEVGTSSPVVTPNGDGINDEVAFRYTLLQLAGAQAVTVDVYDLGGRRVRQVYEGMEASGRRERTWDGRGENGPLPPGVYLYRVQVDADSRRAEASGVIHVAY